MPADPSALHGRDRERAALRTAETRAGGGKGGAVLLLGPAGAGKTALLRQVADDARRRGAAVTDVAAAKGAVEQVAAVLAGAARRRQDGVRPPVVVLDDLDLLPSAEVEPLLALVHGLRDRPAVLVLAGRRGPVTDAVLADGTAGVVEPLPLDPAAVASWSAAELGAALPDARAAEVATWTAGNPYLLREVLRDLAVRGPDADDAAPPGVGAWVQGPA